MSSKCPSQMRKMSIHARVDPDDVLYIEKSDELQGYLKLVRHEAKGEVLIAQAAGPGAGALLSRYAFDAGAHRVVHDYDLRADEF